MASPNYEEVCSKIRSEFKNQFERKDSNERFATNGTVRDVLSRRLEEVYNSLNAEGVSLPEDAQAFNDRIRDKMLYEFLAVLLFAKCSVRAARAFVEELVLGNGAEAHDNRGETPYLLPASKKYLVDLFGDSTDAREFFDEQRPFCTIVIGGAEVITIHKDDKRCLPLLDSEPKGFGSFGKVSKVRVARSHLTMRGNFNHTNASPEDIARKEYECELDAEKDFKKELQSIREILRSSSTHTNILTSLGALVEESSPPKFFLFMPLAEMDLQAYMDQNETTPVAGVSERVSLIFSAIGLANGLEFLHSQMKTPEGDELICYHMDLKPGNILLFKKEPQAPNPEPDPVGNDMIWKLSDFGISRVKTKKKPDADTQVRDINSLFKSRPKGQYSEATATRDARGPNMFMPSEAEKGGKDMDEKSDIWSFGCIISLLFTYMEERGPGLESFSDSRFGHNRHNHNRVDVFYAHRRMRQNPTINKGVISQHDKLVKLARKRNPLEGEAVYFMLRFLQDEVLKIDQHERCNAGKIAKQLRDTWKKYKQIQEAGNPPPHPSKASLPFENLKQFIGLRKPSRSRLSATNNSCHGWRLEIDKTSSLRGCESSPDGNFLVYWNDKVIMLFDQYSGRYGTTLHGESTSGLRTISAERSRDPTLECSGRHWLKEQSWKSAKLTNRYLIALTTGATSNCHIFDVDADRELKTFTRMTLPHPEVHLLVTYQDAPDRNSIVCVMGDVEGRSALWAANIRARQPVSNTQSTSLSETTSTQNHDNAGLALTNANRFDLEWPAKNIIDIILQSHSKGYMIVRSLRSASILSVVLFSLESSQFLKHDLILDSPSNTYARLFTDMACLHGDGSESEVIVVTYSELFCHLEFEAIDKSPKVVVKPPITTYRILKIATYKGMEATMALGMSSGKDDIFLLKIKAGNYSGRAEVEKVAKLRGISGANRFNLRIHQDGDATVALVTAITPRDQCFVYQIDLDQPA